MSFRVVFVVTDDAAPDDGELLGDMLYVRAPSGYRNIVHKVKMMMGLVRRDSGGLGGRRQWGRSLLHWI